MRALLSRIADRMVSPARGRTGRVAELEERLRIQQAWLEELFQSAPEGIAVVDAGDVVLRVNEEFSRMFGYTEQETLGRPINELIIPESLAEEGEWITRSVVQGERVTLETLRCRKDRKVIDVSLLATPIRVGDGMIGAYGIYRDITDRKTNERALRESERRYRALFEQSPVGVFTCDAESRITQCNALLPGILDVSESELVGANLRELQEAQILPRFPATSQRAGPVIFHGPHQSARDRPTRWLALRYAPLRDDEGRPVGGIGVVEDVTARELAERRLRSQATELERVNAELRDRTRELESALQTRNRLYSAINHELRTPISAISLYHELLLSEALGELSPQHREALEQSQTATFHLLELVGDVLDLSRLDAGKMSVNPAPFLLPDLLRELKSTASPLVERYGTELVLELSADCTEVHSDPQRLRQILLNLVSNAAKFGRGKPVRVRCGPSAGGLTIEVIDEGVGIPADQIGSVFEDFVQLGTDSYGSGAGLGLAICKRLADLLGARLEVESEVGRGSTFRVILPHSPPGDAPTQTLVSEST